MMLTLRQWFSVIGIFFLCVAASCLPGGGNPARLLSLFNRTADTGAFLGPSCWFAGVGAAFLCSALLVPKRRS